ncbi:hypothetical protein PSTG_03123 [Puccinia striiformis f. sp. tritici PST-78]|uniref:Tet-like 2OG-Fe(II) oxygenase domain-containing protein n=1 Tax=Puccinia striiformis f. sp. tritici PST-78 TaxID=1165861 RepID=A0A0L0VX66_9BASI|nr:hypothetical protein PSTG_03123 [Puccinia striiformis f. sp. tritici PST-78]
MGVNKVVKPKNAMKSKARNQRRHGARHSTVSRDIQACSFAGEKIVWSMREYHPLHLYPAIYAEKKQPSRRPTADELHQAEKIVDRFHPFDHGKVVVLDRTNGAVLAVIQFLPINKLSDEEKVDINFVTTFLHQSKKFVNVVAPSRTWGGRMWAVGWRKCMKACELFGRYIKLAAARSSPREYIMGNIPFQANRSFMAKHHIPSVASGEFADKLTEFDCTPHITFTSHGFYNCPHRDQGDVTEYAFALFAPTHSLDGTLADPVTTGYNVTGGQFVFPNYRFYIDFKHQGVVKLLWAAKRVKHCTLPAYEPKGFTRMGMSLQITKTAVNTCQAIKNGLIYLRKSYRDKKALYFGGHRNYMAQSK